NLYKDVDRPAERASHRFTRRISHSAGCYMWRAETRRELPVKPRVPGKAAWVQDHFVDGCVRRYKRTDTTHKPFNARSQIVAHRMQQRDRRPSIRERRVPLVSSKFDSVASAERREVMMHAVWEEAARELKCVDQAFLCHRDTHAAKLVCVKGADVMPNNE